MTRTNTRITNNEPLALKVLKLPKYIFEKLLYLTFSIIFLPSKILFFLFEGYLFRPSFKEISYYKVHALPRGLIGSIIFLFYISAVCFPLLLASVWINGSKYMSSLTGINFLKIHKIFFSKISNLFNFVPIFQGFFGGIAAAIQKDLENETFGNPTNLSFRTKLIIYGLTILISAYILMDHLESAKIKKFSLQGFDYTKTESLKIFSGTPQKRLILTGMLTVYFLEDLASIIMTVILFVTFVRYKHISNFKKNELSGYERIYFKKALVSTALLLLHMVALFFLLIAVLVNTRIETEYKQFKKNNKEEDLNFLINLIYLGLVSMIDVVYLVLLFFCWLPISIFKLFSYKKAKKYISGKNWAKRMGFIFKMATFGFIIWGTLILMFPFYNVSIKIIKIMREKDFSRRENDCDLIIDEAGHILKSFWGKLKMRMNLLKSVFVPNRLIYFCKYYKLALQNGVSIKTHMLSYTETRAAEDANDGEDEESLRKYLEYEKEIEEKISEIPFWTGFKTVISELSNHMGDPPFSLGDHLDKEKERSFCEKNFELLDDVLSEELYKSFLMAFACIINPISGLQLIYFAYKTPSCSDKKIKILNDQIGELFPLIFFDIIAFVLTPIFFPISLLLHFNGNLNIFKVLFFNAEPQYGEQIWEGLQESNIFFFKVWKLFILDLYQIFNSFMYTINILFFLASPAIHKKFRKFRSQHWFEMRAIRLVSREMRVVCRKRLKGNFKLWFYKFEEEDHKIVDDVTLLIDKGFWNQRHTLWNIFDSKGELDKDRLTKIQEREETFDDLNLRKDLQKSKIDLGEFEKKVLDRIYLQEAEFLLKYSLLKRLEKWMMRLLKTKKIEIPKIDLKDMKGFTTEEEKAAEIAFNQLKWRTIQSAEHYLVLKLKVAKMLLTIVSSTLLWRALDMKKFMNINLITNIEKKRTESNYTSMSMMGAYWALYKICWKNMWRDILYYWAVFLVLRVDSNCWNLCSKKISELEFKKVPIYEEAEEIEEETGKEGKANSTVNPEEEQLTIEKKIIGYDQKPFLDSIANIKVYNVKRKKVLNQYAKYALNEQLEKIMSILGKIFPHRKNMISKIQTLKRIPQLQNIDSRTANVLIVLILLQDLKIFFLLFVSFCINPLRIYSFWIYTRSERFRNEINPVIDFNRFQSYQNIKTVAFKKAKDFMSRTLNMIKFDLSFYLKTFIFLFFPMRFFSFLRIFLLIKLKLRNKTKGDDLEFNDLKFRDKINERLSEILVEVRKDISSMFSIFVIFVGVFEIKTTWRRVKVLVKFAFKQTPIYRIYNKMKAMTFSDWIEFLGIWWVLGKFGITKETIFGKEKEEEKNEKRRVLLKKIGWKNMIELGDYLTMKDRMTLCTVNKATRKFYMENSVLWLHYYKINIQSNVFEIESFQDISYACLAHFRKIIAEKNISTERDFNLGIRYILKEQAIKSIISFPDLIATPYKVVNIVCDKIGVGYVSPNGFVTKQREDATRFFEDEENLRFNPRIRRTGRRICYCLPKYPSTFRNQFNAATGGSTEKMEEIPRIKGFLHLERTFYQLVLFLSGINAYYRSLFFYKVNFVDGIPFWNSLINLFKALLQLTYCGTILYLAYLYIRFEMTLGCDLITAIIGPFCLNILLGFHLMMEVKYNPKLNKEDLDPRTIAKCFGNFFYSIYRVTAYPVFRFFYLLITKFFAKQLIPTLKNIILGTLEIYESTLKLPTQVLLGKGTVGELLHLIVVLVWVLWPQAFIWGYLSFEKLSFLPVMRSTAGVVISFFWKALEILNYGGWFTKSISRTTGFFGWIWSYIAAFPGFRWIYYGYQFLKKIWGLGFFFRSIESLLFGTVGLFRSVLVLIWFVLFSYVFDKVVIGILLEKEETGGSMIPKVMLSLFVLGFKILRAMKVIKDVQKGNIEVVEEGEGARGRRRR